MAPTSSSWLFRLSQQTVAYHATADAQRLTLMNVTSSGQYRALLERIYGFEAAVELRASAFGLAAATVGARTRVGHLHRDLLALGLTEVDISMLPAASIDMRTRSDALASLIVIERNVLLAGLIRRFLESERSTIFAPARAYLDTHVDGGRRYREFSDVVSDAIVRGDARPDALLIAVRGAFEAQRHWYGRVASQRRPPPGAAASTETLRSHTVAINPTHPRNAA